MTELRRYRVRYTHHPLVDNGPLEHVEEVKAETPEQAAVIVKTAMKCECVLDVERIDVDHTRKEKRNART
ncbi:hypothetical protein [Burkholderia pyrrocinia]|uniref:hypothetical protein n=1 Tax=Burkholderia pyrrocinia TaxID=60550 RepID=UPI001BD0FC31|nr:hypothetical protein [Burkholderia pyrrocinia]QVN18949.1 hypothetical protein JYG32_04210 [Burkholderia pyrrocinia]